MDDAIARLRYIAMFGSKEPKKEQKNKRTIELVSRVTRIVYSQENYSDIHTVRLKEEIVECKY